MNFWETDANTDLHLSFSRAIIFHPQAAGLLSFASMKVELIEKAAQIVGDNQLLVNIVSKRVQQLSHGADPFIPTTPEMGSGDIALTEIIEGKIVWHEMTDEEMKAEAEARQAAREEMEKAAEQAASEPLPSLVDDEDHLISITPNL